MRGGVRFLIDKTQLNTSEHAYSKPLIVQLAHPCCGRSIAAARRIALLEQHGTGLSHLRALAFGAGRALSQWPGRQWMSLSQESSA